MSIGFRESYSVVYMTCLSLTRYVKEARLGDITALKNKVGVHGHHASRHLKAPEGTATTKSCYSYYLIANCNDSPVAGYLEERFHIASLGTGLPLGLFKTKSASTSYTRACTQLRAYQAEGNSVIFV